MVFTVDLSSQFQVVLNVVPVTVWVDEVLTSVVRRVDVNELHFAGVALL